ncbi:SpoIIAA family protein [Marinobacter fonticola]|uniref:STAS/SEC14 domain-containing protein n=1 Tax=Marinobacter fonticola TaxID=2603215 RepID=UPI0011E637A1|nr:STAS/SEC14 domain-containing protein [Marinobacter fonticola]
MLNVKLDREEGIAILEPEGTLTEDDFASAVGVIDPHIERIGPLQGIIIHVGTFPGWASFASMLTHLKFVREHHRQVRKVALVTDSAVVNAAETIGSHMVEAEVRTYPFDQLEQARQWILGPETDA